jgi:hypothetical protein
MSKFTYSLFALTVLCAGSVPMFGQGTSLNFDRDDVEAPTNDAVASAVETLSVAPACINRGKVSHPHMTTW